ncbi:MAG: (d)CMP kinase [Ruminococcaceae bacterium]|nr:(d)CMP kinase [Oscillospiraceae bacterium]
MTKIAIDGPAGAGKSSISKKVAKALGYIYIDTGAMYRTVGLKAVKCGIDTKDSEGVASILPTLDIDIRHEGVEQHIFLDGENVSDKIRTPEISMAASNVSAIPAVRVALVDLQRKLAENHDVVMDGRDIGSFVLPDAEVKIFLTASVEARAQRRYKELLEKSETVDFDAVKEDMILRDKQDSTRAVSPLVVAEGATVIDTSALNFEESVNAVIEHIRSSVR